VDGSGVDGSRKNGFPLLPRNFHLFLLVVYLLNAKSSLCMHTEFCFRRAGFQKDRKIFLMKVG